MKKTDIYHLCLVFHQAWWHRCELLSIAFDGIQQTLRHVLPREPHFSMHAVCTEINKNLRPWNKICSTNLCVNDIANCYSLCNIFYLSLLCSVIDTFLLTLY